jgi:phage-related protein
MAENTNYIGVAMGLDVSDLKSGLLEANKQIQLANSKFKAASSGMEDWTKSAEGLAAKIEQLDTVLKAQQSKLSGLKAEYAKVAKEQGENSEAARKLQVQINNQQAIVNKTEREFKNYKETLEGVEKGQIDLEKVSLKAGKAVKKSGDEAKGASDGFTIARGAVAGFIANGLTAMVSAAGNAIKSVLGLAEATREYRQTLATLDAASDSAGVNAEKMREKFSDLMGVFNDEGAVTEGLNNLMAAGFDEKNIDAITQQLEGAALKFKDTLKFEGLSDGLQETLATGKAIGPFAELLERSGVNLETFDEGLAKATTSADKQKYVLQQLSKLGLADVSKGYRESNANMIEAQKANTEYQNSVAALGEKIEPITTKIREGFTKILEKVLELVSGADLEAFAEKIENAFDGFINDTLPKIIKGIQWMIDNKETLGVIATAIGVVTAALAALNIVLGIQAAIMAANPITWIIMGIIAAITLLVTAIVLAVKHWDKIREAGAAAWNWIKNAWSAAGEWFSNLGKSISEAVSKAWQKVKQGAADAWQGVKNVFSKVGSFFSDTFSRAWQKVKDIFSTGGKIFDGIKDGITSAFKNIVNAIIRGINKVISVPFNALNKVLDKIRGVEIAGLSPFKNLIGSIAVPEIPELARGGILKKGQIGFLEGDGAEAVVPLEKNLGWIKGIAAQLSRELGVSGVKSGAASLAFGGAGRSTVINAGMTVNYNGNLSRKELKRLENDQYTAVRTRLKAEGAI